MRKYDFAKCDRIDICDEKICLLGRYSCLSHAICSVGKTHENNNEEPVVSKREQIAEPEAVEESEYFEDIEETEEVKPAKAAKAYRRIPCQICGSHFVQKSNSSKYCKVCAAKVHRKQKAKSERKRRSKVAHSGQID